MGERSVSKILGVIESVPKSFSAPERQSAEAFEDYSVRNYIATYSGTVEKTPTADNDIVNKAYVDSAAGASIEYGSGAPSGAQTYSLYVDTATSVLYFWDGTQWLGLSGQ